ncbi:MAG: nucleoid-associated protein, partial [Bacteroidota bacterium]
KEDGFRVLSIDNNPYDANYWLYQFLGLAQVQNESYYTRSYLELCENFSKEVVMPAYDKKEQMQFLSDSVDYFNKNESFDFDEFAQSVAPTENMAAELRTYQQDYALETANQFEISKPAIKSAKRRLKSTIKLDNNIQIRLDLSNPDASSQYIEKGFDEEKQLSFYKVYFNEELE